MNEQSKHNIKSIMLVIVLIICIILLFYVKKPSDRYQYKESQTTTIEQNVSDSIHVNIPQYKPFDPNKADYRTMVDAGIPRNIVVSIIKWREAGKVFRIKEDLALCYGMTDSLYYIIEPFINIGEEYRIKPKSRPTTFTKDSVATKPVSYTQFRIDTATSNYLRTIGFTSRQADLVIRYRDMIGGYRNIAEFEECYAVDSAMAARLKPYIIFPKADSVTQVATTPRIEFPIDINSADSATLIKVRGIGVKSVVHIIRYRELLGGYYSTEQISELEMVSDENFRIILPQIWCDSAKIKKICINFARPKELEVHPYISNRMLRRIINHRELKGGWSTIEEMIETKIFSVEEAQRIAPYLDFGTNSK